MAKAAALAGPVVTRRRLRRLWPLAAVVLVAATVFALERSAAWGRLDAALRSLDFDPERAGLIESVLAGMTLALIGALVTGRAWLAATASSLFVGVTYLGPLGAHLSHQVPELFGLREQLQAGALLRNQLILLAITFVASVPAAATGDLLNREVRQHFPRPRSGLGLSKSVAVLASMLGALVVASSVDPLIRYGPEYGVYRPPPLPVRTISDVERPAAPPEVVPTAGQVLSLTYRSQAMGEDRRFNLYLPPTYGLSSSRRHRYPVLYLLHGDPGGPDDWVHIGAPAFFDAGIARGAVTEYIVVMPDGNGHVTAASQWADRWDGRDRIEDAVLELVDFVDQNYRTLRDRRNRAIAGLSSGAFGAVNIAARHPDVFAVGMSFSGYFRAGGPVFGRDPAYARANSPNDLLQDRPQARTVRYVIVSGAAEPAYTQQARNFAAELDRLGVSHALLVVPGGHGWEVWSAGLALGMVQVDDELSLPAQTQSENRRAIRMID